MEFDTRETENDEEPNALLFRLSVSSDREEQLITSHNVNQFLNTSSSKISDNDPSRSNAAFSNQNAKHSMDFGTSD